MTAPLLTLTDVSCRRGGRMLFEGVSLVLAPGDAALVTGPNGTGKSSLLRIAAGLLRPTAGLVERAPRTAFADERHALDEAAPLSTALARWAAIDARPAAALAIVGLEGLEPLPVRLLSTGQRRRAALARVLAGGADLWILDEPDLGLDVDGVRLLGRLLAEHRAGGGAVLVATHGRLDLPDAQHLAL